MERRLSCAHNRYWYPFLVLNLDKRILCCCSIAAAATATAAAAAAAGIFAKSICVRVPLSLVFFKEYLQKCKFSYIKCFHEMDFGFFYNPNGIPHFIVDMLFLNILF